MCLLYDLLIRVCLGRPRDRPIRSLVQKAKVGVMLKSSNLKNEARLLAQPGGLRKWWALPVERHLNCDRVPNSSVDYRGMSDGLNY